LAQVADDDDFVDSTSHWLLLYLFFTQRESLQ
jgi:hypothetical protein